MTDIDLGAYWIFGSDPRDLRGLPAGSNGVPVWRSNVKRPCYTYHTAHEADTQNGIPVSDCSPMMDTFVRYAGACNGENEGLIRRTMKTCTHHLKNERRACFAALACDKMAPRQKIPKHASAPAIEHYIHITTSRQLFNYEGRYSRVPRTEKKVLPGTCSHFFPPSDRSRL